MNKPNNLPWNTTPLFDIINKRGDSICIELYKKDAQYICIAVNNFDKAIKLLKRVSRKGKIDYKTENDITEFLYRLNIIIKEAKEC